MRAMMGAHDYWRRGLTGKERSGVGQCRIVPMLRVAAIHSTFDGRLA
jgi:hypothetical protein